MTQIFSHIVVWFRSLSLFKKSTYSVAKPVNLLFAMLFGLLIVFVLYVYVKIMQVPKLEDKWERFSYGAQCDTLNIIACHNFSNERDGKVILHVPDCPELEALAMDNGQPRTEPGIYHSYDVTPSESKHDAVQFAGRHRGSDWNNWYKEYQLGEFIDNMPHTYADSLKNLDYFSFNILSTTIPPILCPPFQDSKSFNIVSYKSFNKDGYNSFESVYKTPTLREAIHSSNCEIRYFTGAEFDNWFDSKVTFTNADSQQWRNHAANVWRKLYDVSRVNYRLSIPGGRSYVNSLAVYFFGPTEFLPMYPEPDVVDRNYIAFLDSEKLKYIQEHGLEFDAKFPFSENTQNMKIFVLTSVITVLLTLFFRQVYILIRPYLKKIKTKTYVISLSAIFLVILIWMILSLRPIII